MLPDIKETMRANASSPIRQSQMHFGTPTSMECKGADGFSGCTAATPVTHR